jgi:hypothetical protein
MASAVQRTRHLADLKKIPSSSPFANAKNPNPSRNPTAREEHPRNAYPADRLGLTRPLRPVRSLLICTALDVAFQQFRYSFRPRGMKGCKPAGKVSDRRNSLTSTELDWLA